MQEPASCEPLVDSLRPAAELGELGNLSFRFFNYDDDGQSSGATDFELAAGGSRTVAALQGRTAVPAGLTVRSTAPEIGDVALVAGIGTPNADWKTGCHALNVVHVTANQVGAFDVVVEDEAGAVFDRKTFQSVASEHLGARPRKGTVSRADVLAAARSCFFRGIRPLASSQLEQVVSSADQRPFGAGSLDAAHREAGEGSAMLHLAEDRLDGLLA